MINYVKGDIFNGRVEAIVNPVNCVGVMGAGLARKFKEGFPDNYSQYREYCKEKSLQPGGLFITNNQGRYRVLINFATKNHYSQPSEISWIDEGLQELALTIKQLGIRTIAIPALGSGLGGLDFLDVKELIDKHLSNLGNVDIFVTLPQ